MRKGWFVKACGSYLAALCVLTGCGGGGGSAAPAAATNPPVNAAFSIAVDRTELPFIAEEGQAIAPLTVTGNGAGTAPAAVYLGAGELGAAIERVSTEFVGGQARFTVYPKAGLAAGFYRGTVQLSACPDPACSVQFSGWPAVVPYAITVSKPFGTEYPLYDATAYVGIAVSGTINVQLPPGQTAFTVASSEPWLTVPSQTGTTFTVATLAQPVGSYFATLTIRSGNRTSVTVLRYRVGTRSADNSIAFLDDITWTGDIPNGPWGAGDSRAALAVKSDVASLTMTAAVSAAAPARTLTLSLPPGSTALTGDIQYRQAVPAWLTLVRTGERSFSVTADAAALAAGLYQADLIFRSGTEVAPKVVPVLFDVRTAQLDVSGSCSFTANGASTPASLNASMTVDLPNLPRTGWHATSAASWLKVVEAAGVTGQAIRLAVDADAMAKLPNFGSYSATFMVTFDNPTIRALPLSCGLIKRMPEITFIAPHTRLPNEGGTYTLYGQGLSDLPANPLIVTGAAQPVYRRVNDRSMTVTLPSAGAGDIGFAPNNGLGLPSDGPVLRVVAPATYAYAAIPVSGAKGGIAFDAATRSLFTANKTQQAIQRFTFSGGTWRMSSAPLAGAQEVALAPDGKNVVASATPDALAIVDMATLLTQSTLKAERVGADGNSSLQRLAVLGNGDIFYYNGGGGTSLPFYEMASHGFVGIAENNYLLSAGGPWFSAAADGARLLVAPGANASNKLLISYPGGYSLQSSPNSVQAWTESAQSQRGERFVEGTARVWDKDFALIGELVLPDSQYVARSPAIAPDGSRVFLLAYSKAALQGGAGLARVYVFDSRSRPVSGTALPLLGAFDLADYPGCHTTDASCNAHPLATISPDGQTLFYLGTTHLLVVPVPVPVLSGAVQRAAPVRAGR